MADNNLQFKKDLERFARNLDIEVEKAIRKVALDIFKKVVVRTPVDTGALRASWIIGVNVLSTEKVNVTGGKLSKGGATSLARKQESKLKSVNAGDSINITNNQPYAVVVEYGMFSGNGPKTTEDGFSRQAPAGMLRRSIQEVEATFSLIEQEFDRRLSE